MFSLMGTTNCPITKRAICYCKETLRKLFTDHILYTKIVITNIIENLGNTNDDINRL